MYTRGAFYVIFVMYYSSELLVLFYDSLCSSDLACVAKSNSGDCLACVAQLVVACVAQP